MLVSSFTESSKFLAEIYTIGAQQILHAARLAQFVEAVTIP
jgi:hypothetical protein